MTEAEQAELDSATNNMFDILTRQGHDQDCSYRCFKNACQSDHSCVLCDKELERSLAEH